MAQLSQSTEWNKKIKFLRLNNERTQSQVAHEIGVELRTYQRWEKGENYPEPINQEAIAQALGSTVSEIFTQQT